MVLVVFCWACIGSLGVYVGCGKWMSCWELDYERLEWLAEFGFMLFCNGQWHVRMWVRCCMLMKFCGEWMWSWILLVLWSSLWLVKLLLTYCCNTTCSAWIISLSVYLGCWMVDVLLGVEIGKVGVTCWVLGLCCSVMASEILGCEFVVVIECFSEILWGMNVKLYFFGAMRQK